MRSDGQGWRLADLAREIGGEVRGDGATVVSGLRSLEQAGPEDLSFLTRASYREQAAASRAGALLVTPDFAASDRPLLVAENPSLALIRLIELLRPSSATPPAGIHRTAIVGADCEIAASAVIGPYAVLGERCTIGARTVIHAHVVLGSHCRVGEDGVLHPHAVLYDRTELGAGCIVHAGAVLGADGFGYHTGSDGVHHKMPHAGRAVLEDRVEVGANSAVDRAMLEETRIGAGSKIDNLVQVGHNVRTGRGCLLCGQAGIAGSLRLGDHVVMGGQSGAGSELGKPIELGSGVQVAGKSAVFSTVEAGQVGGIPAHDLRQWRREVAALRKLPALLRRVRDLERQLRLATESGPGDLSESREPRD